MQLLSPKIKKLREQLRKLDSSSFNKEAGLGGGQDMPFEQAFSNLAHAYLSDKAPSLQDYEVGFQLIDKNNDNTKAVGVAGFKVGPQWLYAPVFFLNGDLKGHELLYLKNQDLFVPMKENWLNYLVNRKPVIMGEGTDKNLGKIGVLPPNLYQLSRSPSKYASDMSLAPAWAKAVIPDFAYFATESPLHDKKYENLKTVVDLIKDAGIKAAQSLVDHCTTYPALHTALVEAYGEDTLNLAVKEAVAKDVYNNSLLAAKQKVRPTPNALLTKQARETSGKIVVVTYKKVLQKPEVGYALDDSERKTLVKGDVVIKDKRDPKDVSIAYTTDVTRKLMSPTKSGLHDVLFKPGEFKKCLVILGPYDTHGRKTSCLLVDLDSKDWIITHPSKVWVKNEYVREEFDKWFEGLSDGEISSSGVKMLVGARSQGTLPFRTFESNGGDVSSYDVDFVCGNKQPRAVNFPQRKEQENLNLRPHHHHIVCTEHPGKSLTATGSELLVPKGYKVLSLSSSDYDAPGALDLGNLVDIELGIVKSGHLTEMELRHTGTHVTINSKEYPIQDALISLVTEVGLAEKQARDLLSIANEQKVLNCLVKLAEPYELQRSGPTAPPFPEPTVGADPINGGDVPVQPLLEQDMPIPDMAARNYDRSQYDPRPVATSQPYMVGGSAPPDQKAVEIAMGAAQSGQKEVFDTAMLGSLLKSVNDDSMVDKYMGDLMKGMDRLGRILFMLYWHMDEFEERYGKQDLPELESGLRNNLESMGDVVLFLKQKAIDKSISSNGGGGDVDLGPASGEGE